MGLTARLHALAAQRPHVLLLPSPGAAAARVAAERELRVRGWVVALSPADADALLVLGDPGPELARAAERVWAQLPGPRVRLAAPAAADVPTVLDALPARLQDRRAHVVDVHGRAGAAAAGAEPQEPDDGKADDDGTATGMELAGGLAMADRADDRDGLRLDVLHEQLGPALPAWPAGLVLHVTLQGDVAQEVRAQVLPASRRRDPDPFVDHPDSGRLDRLARVLTVAGWSDAAVRSARLRDALLAGERAGPDVVRLTRQVRRSATLRMLARGLPGPLGMDLAEHLDVLCSRGPWPAPPAAQTLPSLLTGLELGALRLVLAAVDVDPAEGAPTSAGVAEVPA